MVCFCMLFQTMFAMFVPRFDNIPSLMCSYRTCRALKLRNILEKCAEDDPCSSEIKKYLHKLEVTPKSRYVRYDF